MNYRHTQRAARCGQVNLSCLIDGVLSEAWTGCLIGLVCSKSRQTLINCMKNTVKSDSYDGVCIRAEHKIDYGLEGAMLFLEFTNNLKCWMPCLKQRRFG